MSLRIAVAGACAYPVPQGSQVYLRETALALRNRGHEVHLVVYGHGLGEDLSDLRIHRSRRLPGDGRTAAGPSLVKPFLDLALLATLRWVVREHAAQVVCAHNYEALAVAIAARVRPIIYFAHNAMADELPYYFGRKMLPERAGRWLDRTLPRRADRIVVPHQRLAGHLALRGCDPARIAVVPPPLDAAQFEPCAVGKEIPPVVYAGNLDAYQNLELLFDAMTRVRAVLPEARLRIATAASIQVPDAEVIHTPDFQALREVLAQDGVFAMPRVSWSGYPIKLLNAMAAGMAVVACASAGHPLRHEENGLVVADNDAAAFAAALASLLREPARRRQLGHRAREAIIQAHAPEKVGAALEAVIYAALEGAPGYAAGNVD